jgi:hypothetical protein
MRALIHGRVELADRFCATRLVKIFLVKSVLSQNAGFSSNSHSRTRPGRALTAFRLQGILTQSDPVTTKTTSVTPPPLVTYSQLHPSFSTVSEKLQSVLMAVNEHAVAGGMSDGETTWTLEIPPSFNYLSHARIRGEELGSVRFTSDGRRMCQRMGPVMFSLRIVTFPSFFIQLSHSLMDNSDQVPVPFSFV